MTKQDITSRIFSVPGFLISSAAIAIAVFSAAGFEKTSAHAADLREIRTEVASRESAIRTDVARADSILTTAISAKLDRLLCLYEADRRLRPVSQCVR